MGDPAQVLIDEADRADVTGWDFSWLDGRASEQRPPWAYHRRLSEAWAAAGAALDVQTGGGEVLAGIERVPPLAVATESWAPNVALATARLHPRGVVVVADPDEPPLPFAAGAFDLVTSRHPATVWWEEIARVLRPGGQYLAQHVGPDTNRELYEFFLGPQPPDTRTRHPDAEAARAAGLQVDEIRTAGLRVEFRDVGAVVYFLRKVLWTVPGFTVEDYRDRLEQLHSSIERHGPFVSHSTRTLIRAHRPG